MNSRIVGPVLIMVACAGAANAQMIRGVVVDAATRKSLPDATIQVASDSGQQQRTASDSAGIFRLSLPKAGLYRVTATHIGYRPHGGDTVRVGADETVTLRLELDANAVPLHPVVVTERQNRLPPGFEQRRAMGFGRLLDRADIESRHPSRTSDIFRGLPGAYLANLPRGRGLILLMRKPGGTCRPAIFMDGLPLGDGGQSLDLMVTPETLEAVEFYQSVSTAPVQYRTGDCGVVLFWSRRVPDDPSPRPRRWKVALGAAATLGALVVLLAGRGR